MDDSVEQIGSAKTPLFLYPLDQLEGKTVELSFGTVTIERLFGSGFFGFVYLAFLDGKALALRVLNNQLDYPDIVYKLSKLPQYDASRPKPKFPSVDSYRDMLKVIHEGGEYPQEHANNFYFLQLFLSEARVLEALNNNQVCSQFVPKFFGIDEENAVIAMEYVEGSTYSNDFMSPENMIRCEAENSLDTAQMDCFRRAEDLERTRYELERWVSDCIQGDLYSDIYGAILLPDGKHPELIAEIVNNKPSGNFCYKERIHIARAMVIVNNALHIAGFSILDGGSLGQIRYKRTADGLTVKIFDFNGAVSFPDAIFKEREKLFNKLRNIFRDFEAEEIIERWRKKYIDAAKTAYGVHCFDQPDEISNEFPAPADGIGFELDFDKQLLSGLVVELEAIDEAVGLSLNEVAAIAKQALFHRLERIEEEEQCQSKLLEATYGQVEAPYRAEQQPTSNAVFKALPSVMTYSAYINVERGSAKGFFEIEKIDSEKSIMTWFQRLRALVAVYGVEGTEKFIADFHRQNGNVICSRLRANNNSLLWCIELSRILPEGRLECPDLAVPEGFNYMQETIFGKHPLREKPTVKSISENILKNLFEVFISLIPVQTRRNPRTLRRYITSDEFQSIIEREAKSLYESEFVK